MPDIDELAALAFNAYWEGAYETTYEPILKAHKERWRRVVRALAPLSGSKQGTLSGMTVPVDYNEPTALDHREWPR